jgi:hypothetical protein
MWRTNLLLGDASVVVRDHEAVNQEHVRRKTNHGLVILDYAQPKLDDE